jgi:hypothetical protein
MRGERATQLFTRLGSAVTNAPFASFHGLPVALSAPSTTPVPLRKSCARHERASANVPQARLTSVSGSAAGVALRLRFATRASPPSALLAPLADRRPKLQRDFRRASRRSSMRRSSNSRVRAISVANSDSFGNDVRYSRTSILFGNPSRAYRANASPCFAHRIIPTGGFSSGRVQ